MGLSGFNFPLNPSETRSKSWRPEFYEENIIELPFWTYFYDLEGLLLLGPFFGISQPDASRSTVTPLCLGREWHWCQSTWRHQSTPWPDSILWWLVAGVNGHVKKSHEISWNHSGTKIWKKIWKKIEKWKSWSAVFQNQRWFFLIHGIFDEKLLVVPEGWCCQFCSGDNDSTFLRNVPLLLHAGVCTAYTLWLCQNSYWKWWFIVDFPIKNGDFP